MPDNVNIRMGNEGETVIAQTDPTGAITPDPQRDRESDNSTQDQDEPSSQSAIQQSVSEDVGQISATEQNSTSEETNTA